MGRVTYTDLRANLARYMDETVESRTPLVVTRRSGRGNVVIMSEEEFSGWQETVHLLRSPRNAERLLRSIRSADTGEARERDLVRAEPPTEA